jgi:hypothetical protein
VVAQFLGKYFGGMMTHIDMYSKTEQQKLLELETLFTDWKKVLAKHFVTYKDDGRRYRGDKYFGGDGFFPNYFSQKTKVLFIGREARWNSEAWDDFGNIVDRALDHCKTGEKLGAAKVFKIMFYLAYGIKHDGTKKWSDVPDVDTVAAQMLEASDFGFAFMNFSKYSNDSDTGAIADKALIQAFLEHSQLDNRNFIREELEILSPNVIITMNLWDGKIDEEFLDPVFSGIKEKSRIEGIATLFEMPLGGKTVKVIDLYHFVARVNEKEYFYDPVMKLLFKS